MAYFGRESRRGYDVELAEDADAFLAGVSEGAATQAREVVSLIDAEGKDEGLFFGSCGVSTESSYSRQLSPSTVSNLPRLALPSSMIPTNGREYSSVPSGPTPHSKIGAFCSPQSQ